MSDKNAAHWNDTKSLAITTLIVWATFGYLIHAFVNLLNSVVFLGFPLGYYMAAQGSLIVFVALIFWSSNRQEAIDKKYDFAED